MSKHEQRCACVECKTDFYLVPPYAPDRSTCEECYAKLKPSTAGECTHCNRIISVGDRFYRTYGGNVCVTCCEDMRWDPDYDRARVHAKEMV